MNRFTTLGLIALLLGAIVLTGCGGKSEDDAPTTPVAGKKAPATPPAGGQGPSANAPSAKGPELPPPPGYNAGGK